MKAREFCLALLDFLKERKDITIKKYKLRYKEGKYDFLRITSKEIRPQDKVILIRAGIHGNEIAGPLTFLFFCNVIIDYIHRAGLKCLIYPLGNPAGFELGKRYRYKGREGNDDFVRYKLNKGTLLVADLGESVDYEKWYWSSDPELKKRLPQETRLMQRLLRKDPLFQIAAVIDLHQDYISDIRTAAAYHYSFGELSRYQSIINEIEELVPILRNTEIGAGQKSSMKSNGQGFVVRHDGTLPDLMFRLGAKYCVTCETTGLTPLSIACKVNLVWIFGITDLLREVENGNHYCRGLRLPTPENG